MDGEWLEADGCIEKLTLRPIDTPIHRETQTHARAPRTYTHNNKRGAAARTRRVHQYIRPTYVRCECHMRTIYVKRGAAANPQTRQPAVKYRYRYIYV